MRPHSTCTSPHTHVSARTHAPAHARAHTHERTRTHVYSVSISVLLYFFRVYFNNKLYFRWCILFDIFCLIYFVQVNFIWVYFIGHILSGIPYILSEIYCRGIICLGKFCHEYFVRYFFLVHLVMYIIPGKIFLQVHFVRFILFCCYIWNYQSP